MTDHADTIRLYLCSVDNDPYKAEDALDALLAERQQAIDERDRANEAFTAQADLRYKAEDRCQHWKESSASFEVETYELGRQLQQAIDERDAAQGELKALRAFASGVEHLSLPGLRSECAALLEQKQQLETRCEQAIDALREIAGLHHGSGKLARAALVSLGETATGYCSECGTADPAGQAARRVSLGEQP